MGARLLKCWDALRTSFWLIPALMMLGAYVLSRIVMAAEGAGWVAALVERDWIYTAGPAGARAVLSTIAGSMVTIAGVVFSITIVVLSLASQQFGPRMIRNFMYDRANQVVLGIFNSTFLYCILALGGVDATTEEAFVPRLSVTTGVVLAVTSLGVLVFFIHHIASSIRVPRVIAGIGTELDEAIDRMFPEEVADSTAGTPAPQSTPVTLDADHAQPIVSTRAGYVQVIDGDSLVEIASEHDAVVEVRRRPGEYVVEGEPVATWYTHAGSGEAARQEVGRRFAVGSVRTPVQDLLFPIEQLSEIAIRALSPGVNDPHTAIDCVHRLGASLMCLASRPTPDARRVDGAGKVRLIAQPVSFGHALRSAYEGVIAYGRNDATVLLALWRMQRRLSDTVDKDADAEAIAGIKSAIVEAVESVPIQSQRERLIRHFHVDPDEPCDDAAQSPLDIPPD